MMHPNGLPPLAAASRVGHLCKSQGQHRLHEGQMGTAGNFPRIFGEKMGGLSLKNRFHVKMGECTQPSRSWLKMDSIPWIYIAILIRKMLRNQSTNPFMKQNRHKNGDFANKGRIGKGCKSHGFGFPYIHFWGNPWETPGVQGKDAVSSKFSFHTIPEERSNSQFQTVVHGFKYGAWKIVHRTKYLANFFPVSNYPINNQFIYLSTYLPT